MQFYASYFDRIGFGMFGKKNVIGMNEWSRSRYSCANWPTVINSDHQIEIEMTQIQIRKSQMQNWLCWNAIPNSRNSTEKSKRRTTSPDHFARISGPSKHRADVTVKTC